jgi:hypothetical protein
MTCVLAISKVCLAPAPLQCHLCLRRFVIVFFCAAYDFFVSRRVCRQNRLSHLRYWAMIPRRNERVKRMLRFLKVDLP